ncbi:MAG TPA: molybdate ABC transporter substrate-binding protein [Methanoregulaceae archaeon]|jgi:molybdate transport system substrate-binding protein|nr:molybdate ABC transporter substrate-binding protein [Burkholderiaceae bacterium]NLH25866.1 molybdate ABC transporter substrate-binding protein [Methanomicrobiales archaeon]HNW81223.1 molybdate ABC transporter substrate-binding protein [Methanoregulaceae archaeon]HPS22268.1 molybdate ABC transporter substrate-binding protein [Methanoregulaceae archaeon]
MKFSWIIPVTAVFLAAILLTGCTGNQAEPGKTELTVFAAASLTGALTDMAETYETSHPGIHVVLNFDGSQALRTQIEQGAYADVFLSANTKHLYALRDQGLMENSSIGLFAKNKLAVITPASNPGNMTTLADLARPGTRLVIGTKDVPVGDYARQILKKMGNDSTYGPSYTASVLANVISEETTVTGVVTKVQIGEADAGIVYESDITPENRDRFLVITIPDQYNVIAEYPAGIAGSSAHKDEAAGFLAYLKGEQGRAILAKYGFALP